MAEMNMPQKNGKRKLQPPRLDLTPMVDLGFILITFFIFTTTLAKSQVMEVDRPANDPVGNPPVVIEESVITVIPVKDHKVYWYEGTLKDAAQVKQVPIGDIREVLLRKQMTVAALPATFSPQAHKLYVIIKPSDDCKYADVVQLLDEMIIINAPGYCMMDITAGEQDMLSKK